MFIFFIWNTVVTKLWLNLSNSSSFIQLQCFLRESYKFEIPLWLYWRIVYFQNSESPYVTPYLKLDLHYIRLSYTIPRATLICLFVFFSKRITLWLFTTLRFRVWRIHWNTASLRENSIMGEIMEGGGEYNVQIKLS